MWHIYNTHPKRNDRSFITERFPLYSKVNILAFGEIMKVRFDIERLTKFFHRSKEFAELCVGDELKGYAFYSIEKSETEDIKILWIDNIANTMKGKARLLIESILNRDKDISFIGCRTQNPAMIRSIQTYGKIYPIELSYTSENGKQLLNFVLDHIKEGQEVAEIIDKSNGITRQRYVDDVGKGYRLGIYDTNDSKFYEIEQALMTFKFNRDNGDAIIVIADIQSKHDWQNQQ